MSEVESWLQPYLPEHGQLALDIGANVGNWTIALSRLCEEVHAFEPNPQCLHMLRGKLAARENVRICEFALGDDVGDLVLHLYPHHAHASAFTGDDLDTLARGDLLERVKVPLVSLDALGYQWRPVDYIKIDTEGAERDVLIGAAHTLNLCRPRLLIEVHTEENRDWIESWLGNFDYQPELLPHPNPGVPAGHCWIVAARP